MTTTDEPRHLSPAPLEPPASRPGPLGRLGVWVANHTRLKHRHATIAELRRLYCRGGWWPTNQGREMFNPEKLSTTRYRYRGTVIPSPWPSTDEEPHAA